MVANAAIVPVGTGEAIEVFVSYPSNLVVDPRGTSQRPYRVVSDETVPSLVLRCVGSNVVARQDKVELRWEFAHRGWNRKATGWIVFELSIHVAVALSGIVIFMAWHNAALQMLGPLISTPGGMVLFLLSPTKPDGGRIGIGGIGR